MIPLARYLKEIKTVEPIKLMFAWIVMSTFVLLFSEKVSAETPQMFIVKSGKPMANIVISDSASEQIRMSAELLQDYINKASKAELPIVNSSDAGNIEVKLTHIWIGHSKFVDGFKLNLDPLRGDGFVIFFPDRQNIVISGSSDWGSEFGVYDFLERYVGVRWLLPGSDGEYVPTSDTIKLPVQEIRQEPVFFSRELSGLSNGAEARWARRNRMHASVKFHHNLGNLLPPKKYIKSHPEFYQIRTKQSLFSKSNLVNWQPCFSIKGVAEEAIRNIKKYFYKHPSVLSYSLGVNDSGGHCRSDVSSVFGRPKKNIFGYESVSESYYKWATAVVEGVTQEYPKKWFGLLAYREVSEPPLNSLVHERIIPFITDDRMQWIKEDREKRGKNITELWSATASHLGWYDYIYGSPYMIPRIYFHEMADYYKYGFERGVEAMYSEAYPNWGEGPKLYVALKLQWNPYLNLDALLTDWYVKAVGAEASADLATYFELWEEFWTRKITKSAWFLDAEKAQYLPYNRPEYLDMVELSDIKKGRKLLESVLAKTKTEKQRLRAEVIMEAFKGYEASVLKFKE